MVRASSVPGSVPGAAGQRAANLRMIALASAVVLAVVLPLAVAAAGPAGVAGREKARTKPDSGASGASGVSGASGAESGRGAGRERAGGDAARAGARGAAGGPRPAGFGTPGSARGPLGQGAADGRDPADPFAPALGTGLAGATRCGPELGSPEGVEAQTCVLERDRDTWARTYYRNATGAPLVGVLTMMAPDGRTVQVNCELAATDDPDMCETPHERTVRGHGSYAAVSEIASTDGKLLLRSGSNSAAPEDG
ncbi:hypothetical protein ACGFLS_29710 [Streptomyces abikoensis]|uniref:hypothetical protein n=1 Tax=Streptomyces abikoensis TaxID=97398 RepID=UPI003722C13F